MAERPHQLNTHVDDQIDAYALGILEDEAVAQVEAHLVDCQECQRLLRQARATVALLALAPRQVQPPARLKQRLLARIAQEEQRPATPAPSAGHAAALTEEQQLAQALDPTQASLLPEITPERQGLLEAMRHLFSGRKGIQAPGTGHPVGAAPDAQHQLQDILRLLRAPHPAVWELPGTAEAPRARARLLGAPEEHIAVLIVSGLDPLPPERDYQLWFLRDGEPMGSAVFDVPHSGEGQILVHAPRQLGHFDLAAITPEPAGGSPGPTGPIIISGEIKAA